MTTEQELPAVEERLRELLHGDDVDAAREFLAALHPADQADLFAELDEEEQETFLSLLSAEQIGDMLEHLDEDVRQETVEKMPRATLARVMDETEDDIAADVLRNLPPAEAAMTLGQMKSADRILPLMQHADETAGGIMTRGYVTLHKEMTVGEALRFLRATKPAAEEAYYLYVLDGLNRLQGVVSLRQLVVSDQQTKIADVMVKDAISVRPDTDQEEVARLLTHYRLRSIPVVDENGVLEGVITSDDIIDVIQEEATEDMFHIAGLPAQDSIFAPVSVSARRRIPWLFVNLITLASAGIVVAAFEGTIQKAAALAVFMPIVAGQGGSAGIQTITIVVRSLALGEMEPRDASSVLVKEISLGAIRGVIFGVLVGLGAWLWQGEWAWGVVVGIAVLLVMLVAGLLGTLIPLTLRLLRLDPAIASGVFLTALTDLLGFFFLLGLGSLLIDQLD
jgi:magnesium transporter